MEFTIITLGDLKAFETALNAIAMIFNPSNTTAFVTDGGLGFGGFIGVALMLALTVALFRGVINLKFELGELIVVAILYAALFVPKFDVILFDYYSDEVAAVDNVPLGIALPGAFISGITVEISEVLGQAFQTANPSVFGIKDQGFVYPLRILNALRNGSTNFKQQSPALSTSIGRLYIDCAYGRDGFSHEDVMNSESAFERLLSYTTSATGITEYYDNENPTGIGLTCQEATSRIRSSVDDYFNASASTQYAGSSAKNPEGVSQFAGLLCGNMRVVKKSTGGCPSFEDYSSALSSLGVSSGTRALDFAKTTLLTGTIKEAAFCASAGPTSSQLAECIPFVTALEQYKEDAVAAGSLFQRTMLNSMSLMLFLFYCFAPIVSILMVVMGAKGIKLLGSYFLFGVWTQSWLPFATILHFYIQIKVNDDLARFGDVSGLITPAKYPEFYSSVSTNLALASDLLAATPILTLALLSGSIFALTGVATRMSGRDYYNEKTNAPDMVSNPSAITNLSSIQGVQGFNASLQNRADPSGVTLSTNNQATQLRSSSMAIEARQAVDRALVKGVQESFMDTSSSDRTRTILSQQGVDLSKTEGSRFNKAYSDEYNRFMNSEEGRKLDKTERQEKAQSQAFQAGASVLGATVAGQKLYEIAQRAKEKVTPKAIADAVNPAKKGKAAAEGVGSVLMAALPGVFLATTQSKDVQSDGQGNQVGVGTGTRTGNTDRTTADRDSAVTASKKEQNALQNSAALARRLLASKGETFSDETREAFTVAESKVTAYSEQVAQSSSVGQEKKLTYDQVMATFAQNPELADSTRKIFHKESTDPAVLGAFLSNKARMVGTKAETDQYVNQKTGQPLESGSEKGSLYAMVQTLASQGNAEFVNQFLAMDDMKGNPAGKQAEERFKQNGGNIDTSVLSSDQDKAKEKWLASTRDPRAEELMGRVRSATQGDVTYSPERFNGYVDQVDSNFSQNKGNLQAIEQQKFQAIMSSLRELPNQEDSSIVSQLLLRNQLDGDLYQGVRSAQADLANELATSGGIQTPAAIAANQRLIEATEAFAINTHDAVTTGNNQDLAEDLPRINAILGSFGQAAGISVPQYSDKGNTGNPKFEILSPSAQSNVTTDDNRRPGLGAVPKIVDQDLANPINRQTQSSVTTTPSSAGLSIPGRAGVPIFGAPPTLDAPEERFPTGRQSLFDDLKDKDK